MKESDLLRGLSKKPQFQVVEKISGVPWVAIAALWGALNGFRLTNKENGHFGIAPGSLTQQQIEQRLISFAMLTLEEISDLAEKGTNNFFCASLLAAFDLKANSKTLIYPDAPDEVIERALAGRSKEAVPIYRKLKGLEKK